MNAFSFSPSPWNFWPVMSQAVRKNNFSTSIPRGQNPRFLDFPTPRFLDFLIPRFLDFPIPRFLDFPIPRFLDFLVSDLPFYWSQQGSLRRIDPWVRWERGQVGIREFVRRRRRRRRRRRLGPSGWAHVGPTHEKNWGKFLKILFTHEKMEANSWKYFSPMKRMEANLGPQKSKNQKFSKSKSVLPKLSARFFYAGERRPRSIWGPPGPFFP